MGAPLCSRAVGAGGNWYWCWSSPGARDSTMSPGRDLGSGRGSGTPCPLLPVRRPERDWPAISRGYRIAVEGHRWRPADEQEPSRLTRIAVDRGVEPQTVRVISAPLILDGPGRPGAGRSSSRCCAVMDVARFKDAGPAVSRICGHGSPIPIFAQVRGILMIVMHRWAAADGSAHRRAFTAVGSRPPDPDRPHGGHSSLTARARCEQHGPSLSTPPRLPAASRTAANAEGDIPRGQVHVLPGGGIRRRRGQQSRPPTRETSPAGRKCPRTRRMSPAMAAAPGTSPKQCRHTPHTTHGDIPRGRARVLPARGIRRRRGQQSRPPTRNTSPTGRKCPRTRRMSPHASELSETRRTLVVSNTARLPLSRGHRCPRMATDSTTADTTFIRAALRAIVTIGDS